MINKIKIFFKTLFKEISRVEMQFLPGQIAFHFVLSMIPIITILSIIITRFSFSIGDINQLFNNSLPTGVANLLLDLFKFKGSNIDNIIFIISSFILASNGSYSIVVATNIIYSIDDPNTIKKRIKSFIMTIVITFLLLFMLLVPAFGDSILALIMSIFKKEAIIHIISRAYHILKTPLSILFIFIGIKILYTMAPSKKIKSKETTIGALATTFSWIIATKAYSLYVSNFVHYDLFYGSISNVLILLLWVYLLAYLFVLGIAMNASLYKKINQD